MTTAAQEHSWPGAENDPPGSKFYSWPSAPPAGEWAYILDDFGVTYRRDTLWPFASARTGDASDEASIRSWERKAAASGS